MTATNQPVAKDRPWIDFVDPLFAVVVHIGLTHGVLNEGWFKEWRFPRGDETLHLFSFLLGFTFVALSWVGYHRSIRARPLRGYWRFILDVALVTLYAFLLVKYEKISAVLLIMVVVYLLFVLWDWAKIAEYREEYASGVPWSPRNPREFLTFVFFIFFALLLFIDQLTGIRDWALLGLMWFGTILYRFSKAVPFWQKLWLGVKAFGVSGAS